MKSIIANDEIILPDFIETNIQHSKLRFKIPTTNNVEARPVRRKIVKTAYKTFLTQMRGNNFVKNDFLDEKVHIIFRENYLKASNNAVRCWQTTYAVLHIYDVIKYAKPIVSDYIIDDIKTGFQKNNHYVKLYKFVYDFKHKTIPYMNFQVEILFGRKTTGALVQYSIEYKKRLVNLCRSRSNRF